LGSVGSGSRAAAGGAALPFPFPLVATTAFAFDFRVDLSVVDFLPDFLPASSSLKPWVVTSAR
jgi:hypothetical protein